MNDATIKMGQCRREIEHGKGFFTSFALSEQELKMVRGLVEDHWRCTLLRANPDLANTLRTLPIDRYHEISHQVDHKATWDKKARILPLAAANLISQTSLFAYLRSEFGDFEVVDDEGSGYGEIYWRLVRPDEQDVGPIHADCWFWRLGHGDPPSPGQFRIKVWLALWCQPGRAGLKVVAESQKRDWPFYGETRDGFVKPQTDLKESDLDTFLVPTNPGEAIFFSDFLLHGGTR